MPPPGAAAPVPRPTAVRVRVPATSANLGPGFDAFALALDLHDEVEVRLAGNDGEVRLEVHGEGAADLPRDETHLVVRAVTAAFAALGRPRPGLVLRCTNRIPHGRGLGSSAAAVVAGLAAARALGDADGRLGEDDLLALGVGFEGHVDNLAACLHGGLTLAWCEERPRVARLTPLPSLRTLAFVPVERLATAAARALLPSDVPHADA
ncbi:MAG: homoserine kinase, partial [Actinomycetota bacterium]|nr:homoserine kinase [Actinomycetota bacterium]